MLKQILLVGLGGSVGSILRFLVSKITYTQSSFPWTTFIVNLAGCFLIGLLTGLAVKHQFLDANMRLLLVTGFCGGFTTFSAFSIENVYLYQSGNYLNLTLYVAMSLIAGFFAVMLGLGLGKF
ncbi:MAG: fluoride efflux transporter CrcB [Candidatus Symbiothrix sp.]|nr:fluoride efflux transporter CrcB [Candidatus Symbiothrix sp.]